MYYRITSRLFFVLFVLILAGCGKETPPPSEGLNKKLKFDAGEYQAKLNEVINSSKQDTFVRYRDTLQVFYSERNYQPVFIKSFEDGELVSSLQKIIASAGDQGLTPDAYHAASINEEYSKAINLKTASERYIHLANTELLVTDAVLKYAHHLRYGVLNPKKVFPTSYFLPSPDSASRNLFAPLRENDIASYLKSIEPKNPEYKKLMTVLKKYRALESKPWDPIIFERKKLEPGQTDSAVSRIAERLYTLGFMDSAPSAFSNTYDSVLVSAVKKFQGINGLKDDGVIGKVTIERLNIKPADYVDKIRLNMERFRWFDYSGTDHYVLVNIPDFMLYVRENGKVKFNIKVCTGRRRSPGYDRQFEIYQKTKNIHNRPDDWETPCMKGEISYFVLNPTWTVPDNIIREEIAREMRKDSLYLQRKNFRVLKNGEYVNVQDIKLSDMSGARIPYTIVQDPGAGNALGKIKFMFTNPFGIYLHDTPTRGPFTYVDRAVSHGCIRVEKPLMLSEYLLQFQSKWNLDYLKIEIGSKADDKNKISEYRSVRSELRKNHSYGPTTELRLDQKVPLFVDYYTSWVDDNGYLNYRDDVYKKDGKLLNALNSEE